MSHTNICINMLCSYHQKCEKVLKKKTGKVCPWDKLFFLYQVPGVFSEQTHTSDIWFLFIIITISYSSDTTFLWWKSLVIPMREFQIQHQVAILRISDFNVLSLTHITKPGLHSMIQVGSFNTKKIAGCNRKSK